MSLLGVPSGGSNCDSSQERQPVDLAIKFSTMKQSEAGRLGSSVPQAVSQIRGIAAVSHAQTRVLNSGIQTISSVPLPLSLSTVSSQPTLKQATVPRSGLAAATTASTITLTQGSTMVTTRPALGVHTSSSHISTTYHVPRGAAAVANIAAPRSAAVATPIARATAGVTTASHASSFVSGLRGLGPSSLTAPRVSSPATSGTTWLSGATPQPSIPAVAVPKAVSPRPRAPITTIPTYTQGRPTSMTVTAKPVTPQVSQAPRPQLLHTSTQKTISATQLHISENSYFKQGVSVQSAVSGGVSITQGLPARTQAPLTYSSSPSPLGTAHFSATGCTQATLIATQPHQITLSQGISGQARLGATGQGTVLTATSTQRSTQMTAVLSPPPRIPPPASPVRLATSAAPSIPALSQSGSIGTVTVPTRPSTPSQAVITGTARLNVPVPVSTTAAPVQARLTAAVTSVAVSQLGTIVSAGQTRLVTSGGPTAIPSVSQPVPTTRLTVSTPSQIHQSTTVLPAQARITVPNSAIASAGVVSLHPVVVSNPATTLPLKPVGHPPQLVTTTSRSLSTHQAVGPKVIAQPVHGPSIQITQVPVSSVAGKVQPTLQQAALTITTGATRPVTYTATTTLAGTSVSNIRPVTVATSSAIPVAKVFPQAAPVSEVTLQAQAPPQATSVYIQTAHRQSPAPSSTQVSVERASSMLSTYSLPTFYYEQPSPSYQVASMVTRPFTPSSPYAVQTTTTTAAPTIRTSVAAHQVHGTLVQPDTSVLGQNNQLQPVSKPNASPRPSILRKRDNEGSPMKAQKNLTPVLASLAGPVSPPSPRRPDSRGNGGNSSGGSTTISATSSPGLGEAGEDSLPPIKQEPVEEGEKSPRKKPRKQQLHGNELHEPKFSEDEMEFISEEKIKKEVQEVHPSSVLSTAPEESEEKIYIPKRPNISLINSYRYTWKSRHNHYLRYSDVKPKDERRPTVTDLANQKQVLQKLNGWKIHHLSTQMEDLAELETQVFEKLAAMLKVMEKKSGKESDKDVNRVNELIKGNMQRSKVIKDQMEEAKCQVMKIFDHKCHVTDIISRCANKRSMKKREKS
ncbi:histone deacetylase complex subunit SAP130 isoform X2 [Anabrus simplex]|uniref:histone deacetylase complex subunit SAP130 isoform X2 n=1 Tax=Anabrus simplex TaxID=316456 RepID=UPI0035A31970